jgi:hypothetical protein
MLTVAKCCLMAILRSDLSPASLLPGFFSRYKPHYEYPGLFPTLDPDYDVNP